MDGDEIQWHELFQMAHTVNYSGYFNFEPRGMLADHETLNYIEQAPEKLFNFSSS